MKVLGTGELKKALVVSAHKFTEGAKKKIEAAGGRCEVLPGVKILESFRNIFAIPDLRKRVLFTFGLLAIYRIGSHIPTPGLDASALEEFFKASAGGLLGFLDMFSGGALRRLSVFALGITPYITASIILQLLTVVWPYLEKLSKEGEMGRRKITQYTRYGTVVLSVVQGAGIALWLWSQTTPSGPPPRAARPGVRRREARVRPHGDPDADDRHRLRHVARRADHRARHRQRHLAHHLRGHRRGPPDGRLQLVPAGPARPDVALHGDLPPRLHDRASSAAIVFVERAQRRIPVQYAKRVVGRKVYGGQNTYLPLRVNTGGVIPIIFAVSIIQFPQYIASAFKSDFMKKIAEQLSMGQPLYNLFYAARDHLLLLLLHLDHLQPERHRREHAQVRRVHPGHPPGKGDVGLHRQRPDAHHAHRRASTSSSSR